MQHEFYLQRIVVDGKQQITAHFMGPHVGEFNSLLRIRGKNVEVLGEPTPVEVSCEHARLLQARFRDPTAHAKGVEFPEGEKYLL